jgi:hypothetical protein
VVWQGGRRRTGGGGSGTGATSSVLFGAAHIGAGEGEAKPGDSVITTKDELPKLAASFCGLLDVRTEALIDAVGLAATLMLVAVLLVWLACSTEGYLA